MRATNSRRLRQAARAISGQEPKFVYKRLKAAWKKGEYVLRTQPQKKGIPAKPQTEVQARALSIQERPTFATYQRFQNVAERKLVSRNKSPLAMERRSVRWK